MDQQIEAVTEVLRQHRTMLKRITHPRNDRWLMNITACTGCDWTSELLNAEAEDAHAAHVAALILASLNLRAEWAAADAKFEELGGGVIEATIGRTSERADRWMSVDEPGWVKVSRLTSPWVVVEHPQDRSETT